VTELDDTRLFLQRRNGAGPGTIVDYTTAAQALERAATAGHDVQGSLASGHASWRNRKLDADFTYEALTAEQADALRRSLR